MDQQWPKKGGSFPASGFGNAYDVPAAKGDWDGLEMSMLAFNIRLSVSNSYTMSLLIHDNVVRRFQLWGVSY